MIISTAKIDEAKSAISGAVDRAHTLGYDDGRDDGYRQGFAEGVTSNDEEVFNEGYNQGYTDGYEDGYEDGSENSGYDEGYEDGVQTERQMWWGGYLDHGNRNDLASAFAGLGWTDKTFKPPYDLIVKGSAQNMFNKTAITDVAAALEKMDVTLNTSGATSMSYIFGQSSVTRVPKISMIKCKSLVQLFSGARQLHTIEGLEFSTTEKQTFSDTFKNCGSLVNINEVKGTIQSDINFGDCPLNKASIENIFEHLLDIEYTVTNERVFKPNPETGKLDFAALKVKILGTPLPSNVSGWVTRWRLYRQNYNVNGDFKFNENGESPMANSEVPNQSTLAQLEFVGIFDASRNQVTNVNYQVLVGTYFGATITLSKSAVDIAFETSKGANDGSISSEWAKVRDSRPYWTVALK